MTGTALCVSLASLFGLVADESRVVVRVTPTSREFRLAEPITVRVTIANNSTRALQLPADHGRLLGLKFSCDHEDCCQREGGTQVPPRVGAFVVELAELPPGEQHESIVALKRYLVFQQPARHEITYSVAYRLLSDSQGKRPGRFRASGRFTVDIVPGELTQGAMLRLRKKLEWSLEEMDPDLVAEAVELLCWVDDLRVIPDLERAACRFSPSGDEIARALGRLSRRAGGHEKARRALLRMAPLVSPSTIPVVFTTCRRQAIMIPTGVYHELLLSSGEQRARQTLLWLVEHGELRHLPLVELLTTHGAPRVASLAAQIVDRLRGQARSREADRSRDELTSRLRALSGEKGRTAEDLTRREEEYLHLVALLGANLPDAEKRDAYAALAAMYWEARDLGAANAEKAAEYFALALEYPPVDGQAGALMQLIRSRALVYGQLGRGKDVFPAARRRAALACLKGLKVLLLENRNQEVRDDVPQVAEADEFVAWLALLYAYRPRANGELERLARAVLQDDHVWRDILRRVRAGRDQLRERMEGELRDGRDPRIVLAPGLRARANGTRRPSFWAQDMNDSGPRTEPPSRAVGLVELACVLACSVVVALFVGFALGRLRGSGGRKPHA